MANNKKDKGRLPQGMHFDEVRGYYVKRFTVEGKRYTVYGKTKTEALAKETDLRQKLNEGSYIRNKAITLNQYFEEWAKRQEGQIKGATIFNYKTMYANHVRRAIGGMKVQKIERRQIVALFQKVAKTSGPSVANQMKILLGTLLKSAVQDEIIKTNPAENIKRIKTDGGAKGTGNDSQGFDRRRNQHISECFQKVVVLQYLPFPSRHWCSCRGVWSLEVE